MRAVRPCQKSVLIDAGSLRQKNSRMSKVYREFGAKTMLFSYNKVNQGDYAIQLLNN